MTYTVRMGAYYCIRESYTHKLLETGEYAQDGRRLPDFQLDRTNPAATVPAHLEGSDGPSL